MTGRRRVHAAAGRTADLRPLTAAERREHTEHVRRARAAIAEGRVDDTSTFRLQMMDGQVLDGLEHAMGDHQTLCGLPESAVVVMRHTFDPADVHACRSCAATQLDGGTTHD